MWPLFLFTIPGDKCLVSRARAVTFVVTMRTTSCDCNFMLPLGSVRDWLIIYAGCSKQYNLGVDLMDWTSAQCQPSIIHKDVNLSRMTPQLHKATSLGVLNCLLLEHIQCFNLAPPCTLLVSQQQSCQVLPDL